MYGSVLLTMRRDSSARNLEHFVETALGMCLGNRLITIVPIVGSILRVGRNGNAVGRHKSQTQTQTQARERLYRP